MELCVECKKRPHERWPAEGEGELCQECWEKKCSQSWWEMVRIVQERQKEE